MTTPRKKAEVDEVIKTEAEQEKVTVTEEVHIDIHEVRKAETVQTLIYIGPSLPGNTLQQHATFTDGFPIQVKAEIEKCPFIQELMVPVSNLAEATSNLSIKGTKDYVMYEKIVAFYKEVV